MPKITILVKGYVRDQGATVQGTSTLVQDAGHNIVVDPGMTHDPGAILEALKAQGLQSEDIDTVFITHHHPDHTRHMGLFPNARVIDHSSIYDHDKWLNGGDGYAITPNAKIIHTPGHTKEDATLIVSEVTNIKEKSPCVVGICHLWWFEGKDDDPTAQNMGQLRDSRAKVLASVDYIVPGHGPMFKAH